MPELIERGHLYIAQPPLYRAKRGNDERYLKDDRALDSYLLDKALHNASLTLADGARLEGAELATEANFLRDVHANLRGLGGIQMPLSLLEQAAVAGVLGTDYTVSQTRAQDFQARLNAVSLPAERGWIVSVSSTGLDLARTVRGVAERYSFDPAALRSAEARFLAERHARLARDFAAPAVLRLDSQEHAVGGPASAFERILQQGRRGLAIQRFKGLGEMNPDQLWKTTLDPSVRTLLQVRVGDAEDAAQVFSTLMGDVVEPRRDFIVGNALKVANLDV
jgi:DNA gyrase subunit B